MNEKNQNFWDIKDETYGRSSNKLKIGKIFILKIKKNLICFFESCVSRNVQNRINIILECGCN